MTSSLRRWNWRLSCSPLRMKSTFPQYRSVAAKTISWPQGFSTRSTGTAKRSRSRRFGVSSLMRRSYSARCPSSSLSGPPRMRAQVVVGQAKVLRRVDGEPDALVAERAQTLLARQLRKRRALLVAARRQAWDGLLAEHVDAAARPEGKARRLPETGDDVR